MLYDLNSGPMPAAQLEQLQRVVDNGVAEAIRKGAFTPDMPVALKLCHVRQLMAGTRALHAEREESGSKQMHDHIGRILDAWAKFIESVPPSVRYKMPDDLVRVGSAIEGESEREEPCEGQVHPDKQRPAVPVAPA